MTWTDERVELLKKLWADGRSASDCARRLGGFDNIPDGGRSAVIGKVHRLGLPSRATTSRTNSKAAIFRQSASSLNRHPPAAQKPNFQFGRRKRVVAVTSNVQPIKCEPGPAGGVPFADLKPRGQCKFELSGFHARPENFRFCGARTAFGVPYCEHHAAIAYNSWARKRKKAA